MTYEVRWLQAAHQQFETIWWNSPDKNAIMFAGESMSLLLADDAASVGESRGSDEYRIAFEKPLQFMFRVRVQERIVEVSQVKRFGKLPE